MAERGWRRFDFFGPRVKTKLNLLLVKSIIVGALGGLLFGFDTAVIAGTTHQLTHVFGLSPKELGFTVSIALVGTIVGALFAGILGDKLGGRESLRILAGCYIISALGCAFAWSWPSLLVFRFIGGLGIGGSSVLGPVYIAEIAPAQWRGRLVGTFQINIVVGILAAYLSNYLIGLIGFGVSEWRWQLGVAALPAILFLVMLFGIPRSARWLVTKNRIPEARVVLQELGSPIRRANSTRLSGRSMSRRRLNRSRCSSVSTGCRFFWRSQSRCSTNCRASTRSCITSTIFSAWPASAGCQATSRRSPWAL